MLHRSLDIHILRCATPYASHIKLDSACALHAASAVRHHRSYLRVLAPKRLDELLGALGVSGDASPMQKHFYAVTNRNGRPQQTARQEKLPAATPVVSTAFNTLRCVCFLLNRDMFQRDPRTAVIFQGQMHLNQLPEPHTTCGRRECTAKPFRLVLKLLNKSSFICPAAYRAPGRLVPACIFSRDVNYSCFCAVVTGQDERSSVHREGARWCDGQAWRGIHLL